MAVGTDMKRGGLKILRPLCRCRISSLPALVLQRDSPCQVLLALLLDLDVKQAKRMQSQFHVLPDPLKPRIGSPAVGEERYRHGLPVVVQRESNGADGVHDGGVVDHGRGDVESFGAEEEIGVRGSSA